MLVFAFYGCSVESIDSNEEIISVDAKGKPVALDLNAFEYPKEDVCLGENINFAFKVPVGTNNLQIQEFIDGEWVQVFHKSKSTLNPETFALTYPVGTYQFRYFAGPGGHTRIEPITVVNCSNCTNSFSTTLVCDEESTLNISFYAEESGPIVIQGGLTNGAVIVSAESESLNRNLIHPSVRNSNSSVTRWEGDVEACNEIIITIKFTGGNGIGEWTAKRDEIELGSSVEQSCEE